LALKLDLQFFAQEKTEKATPKKKQESRKKGQVAKSQDVNTALILLFVFLLLVFTGGMMREQLLDMVKHGFQEYMLWNLSAENIHMLFLDYSIQAVFITAPIMAIVFAAAMFANYVQVGFLFSTDAVKMKLNKLDPIQGAKRIFSIRAIVELLKSLLKISLVGAVAFAVIWLQFDEVMLLSQKSIAQSLSFLGFLTVQMGIATSILLLLLSIFDYLYQRYDFEKSIKMSKQDIKDEYKKMEGDPKIKSKIKEKQRQMAMQRMMQEVPQADVVITNPTHFAVVLKYDEQKADAPLVVAKGVDYVAVKIKDIAKHHDVIMIENRPLARALYAQVEIGEIIPEQFYKAIAEILAYVFKLKKKA
jgi:flagellar biosynthetic protein FlhB